MLDSRFRNEVAQSVLLTVSHGEVMLREHVSNVYLRYVCLVSLDDFVELRECSCQHAPNLGVDAFDSLVARLSIACFLDSLSDSLFYQSHLLEHLVLDPLCQGQCSLLLPLELLLKLFRLLH